MVARGDLGVELGYAELTGLQKHIIARARAKSRLVITATQMMESMIHAPVPTRAEVSDVANAVMDDTDAVMLSAETAVGRHPGRVVRAMAQVIEGAEKWQHVEPPGTAHGRPVPAHGRGHRRGGDVHREPPRRARDRRPDRVRLGRAVDVAHALGHPDLRLHAPRGDAAARDALPRRVPGRTSTSRTRARSRSTPRSSSG